MKKIINYLIVYVLALNTAFGAIPFKPQTDEYILGIGNATADKLITIDIGDGASNPVFKIDKTAKDFSFNKGLNLTDGSSLSVNGNSSTFGDGTTADKKFIFDTGAGASNPYFGFSNASNALVFNNGVTEKKIGSGTGAGGGGINFIVNNSFEDPGSPILNWSNTGGTFTQETHTNGRDGNEKFARFVASGAGQYFESDLVTLSDDVNNKGQCMAHFAYKQGDSAFKYEVLDELNVVKSTGTVSDLTVFKDAPIIVFDCAPGDQRKFRVTSTGAGTIDADGEVYLGSNKGFVSGVYANSIKLEGNDGRVITAVAEDVHYSGTGNGWTSVGDDNHYKVQRNNSVIEIKTSVNFNAAGLDYLTLYKNDILYKELGDYVNYSHHAGSYISKKGEFLKDDELSIRAVNGGTLLNANSNHYLVINEKSDDAQEAWTPEQADFEVDALLSNTSSISLGSNFTDTIPTSASITLSNIEGSCQVACAGTEESSGATCTGSESVGISCNIPRNGSYDVCAEISGRVTAGTSGGGDQGLSFKVVETENASQTVIQEHDSYVSWYIANTTVGGNHTHVSTQKSCSTFNISSVGKHTFRSIFTGLGSAGGNSDLPNSIAGKNTPIRYTIKMASHDVSQPILTNGAYWYPQQDLTVSGTNWTTAHAKGMVYYTDEKWFIKLDILGDESAASATSSINITGLTFLRKVRTAGSDGNGAAVGIKVESGTNQVDMVLSGSATFSRGFIGSFELSGKPTFLP